MGPSRIRAGGMEIAPRSPPDQNRLHPCRSGGEHIVVESIPDVQHLIGPDTDGLGHFLEKAQRWLLDPEVSREEDCIGPQIHRFQGVAGLGGLVARDHHSPTHLPQAREGRSNIRVEVVGVEVLPETIGIVRPPSFQLFGEIESGTKELEDLTMGTVEGGHAAQHTEKGQPGHAKPVGPPCPDPGLVDQGFAYVECDSGDHAATAEVMEGFWRLFRSQRSTTVSWL